MFAATTEHALRALVHLARQPAETSILGRDLAERASIPANYLSKILLALRNTGYVETTRGHGGGYRLVRPAGQIVLVDIVELFEGIRGRPGCLLGEKDECSDCNPCAAHDEWKKVRSMYLNYLASTTIADLVGPTAEKDSQRFGKSCRRRRDGQL